MTDLRRLYYISDPSSIATNLLPDPVRESDLRSWIDTVADAGVSTFCQEVFSQGWTAYFRSQHPDYEYDQRRQHRRFLPLLDGGVSPLDILIDEAHARGMGFLAGFRINDDHAFQARQQGLDIARFIDANPQFQLTEFPEGEFYRLAEPLDFTHPEVRDFTMRIIAEVVHRFDVDGIELCFRDHGYFPLDQGEARAHLMTDMLRQTRAILNEGSGGRRLTLGVRVFSTIEECLLLGLDVAAWIDAGLIDHVSPQDVMYGDLQLQPSPLAPRRETWRTGARLFGCHLCSAALPSRPRRPGRARRTPRRPLHT
jgi:uncharacterized lipoprotein YddW (UPF0748 family)